MKKTTVINLASGPRAGKSTLAAEMFYKMKKMGLDVELVTEYAKELVYQEDFTTLSNQVIVTQEQCRRQLVFKDKVEYIVTDSPIFLGMHYSDDYQFLQVEKIIKANWDLYDNVIVNVKRFGDYVQKGRVESEDESEGIDTDISKLIRIFGSGPNMKYSRGDDVTALIDMIRFRKEIPK